MPSMDENKGEETPSPVQSGSQNAAATSLHHKGFSRISKMSIILLPVLVLFSGISWFAFSHGYFGVIPGPSDHFLGAPLWTYHNDTTVLDQIHWTPDSQHLSFSSSLGDPIHVLNVATRQIQTFPMPASNPTLTNRSGRSGGSEGVSPNAQYMFMVDDNGPVHVQVWDIVTGQKALDYADTFPSTMPQAPAAEWSADSKYLAVGDDNGRIILWDAMTRQRPVLLSSPGGNVSNLAWSLDGLSLAASADQGQVGIWNLSTRHMLPATPVNLPISALALSPDGKRLALATNKQTIEIWDISTGTRLLTYAGGTDKDFLGPQWSPDNTHIISAALGTHGQNLRIWNAATGQTTTDASMSLDSGWISSPDGRYIAIENADGSTIQVWDTTTGHLIATHSNVAISPGHLFTWSPDSRFLATERADNAVEVWSVTTGKDVYTYVGSSETVWNASWSPDGKYLATLSTHMTYDFSDFNHRYPHLNGSSINVWHAPD